MDKLLKSAGWVLMGVAGLVWLLCLLPATDPAPDFSVLFSVGLLAFLFGGAMAFSRPEERPGTENLPQQSGRWKNIGVCFLLVPIGVLCLMSLSHRSRPVSARSQCKNNLKQIGLALHVYQEKYGCFPPAYVADANGRPMHSWRVLILPFLDQAPLYDKYQFDEPWDGPHNQKLADKVLPIYNCPGENHGGKNGSSTITNYVAIVGPETAWPESGTEAGSDIADGLANTLLVVEVANSGIHWMEPRDLHVVQMTPTINPKSGQGISSRHPGGANVMTADGSVRFIPDRLSTEDLRPWVTAHAGDESEGF